MKPTRLEIRYDGDGNVAAIESRSVVDGTATFGGVAENATKAFNDSLSTAAISDATRNAISALEAAIAADVQVERQRVATFRQAEADEAAASAAAAAARAAKEAQEVPTP